jgi:hypothetical protein
MSRTQHFWGPFPAPFEYTCVCGGPTEYLEVRPKRGRCYINRIFLCLRKGCRKIIPA